MSETAKLRAAINAAVTILDDSDIGDEEAVEKARAVLWAAYQPTCPFTGWRKSDGDEVYCVLGVGHDGEHDDGEHDDVGEWEEI